MRRNEEEKIFLTNAKLDKTESFKPVSHTSQNRLFQSTGSTASVPSPGAQSLDPCETTPREETPREEIPLGATPRNAAPREVIPPAPLPPVVSPGPSVGPANVESSREGLTLTSERETPEPSVTDGNKKRSAPDSSASAASQARTESDGPPKKKKKKEKKKKKSVEEQSEPAEDVEGRETRKKTSRSHESSTPAASASAVKTPSAAPQTVVEGGSASEEPWVKFRDRVEFKYVGETPLSFGPTKRVELIRQIKGGRKDLPAVKDLIFKDAYVDAARTKILSDGSMNYVVELYDSALKEAMSKLKHSDKLLRAKDVAHDRKTREFKATIDKVAEERTQLIGRKKAHFLEKFGELKDKFEAAGANIRGLEEEKKALSDEPTGRELGDSTVPLAPDPTTLSASLVVNEGPLVLALGTSVAAPTPDLGVDETEAGFVILFELSDSSTEEESGENWRKLNPSLQLDAQVVEGGPDRIEY
ncbi:hypothetical protein F2Q69_00009071 [Brassica cretica]|uniref:Uncharacterized protein n=1 Tax=Brassica cretica TaxID=69181 RepID=A0A8S9PJF7_BRACR|nr:hypothetical protein F2Q69_00009071 [Brassica cretica]